tara:strand:+ start:776 stop:1228 length:453 start_codon:yes stop_codon:yes gene_type:complete
MKIKVSKIREDVKLPTRAHSTDAGMDIYYNPEDKEQWVSLRPNESYVFGTGVKIEVPKNHMLQIMNKSGIASKNKLVVGACVIDHGYDGEVYINLHNIGLSNQLIEPGQKIAQAVMIPIVLPELSITESDTVYDFESERGAGGFGSTGVH